MPKSQLLALVALLAVELIFGRQITCAQETAHKSVELQCDALTESSGLAVSQHDAQLVWSHNDSGDGSRLFAFTREGNWIAEVKLNGVKAIDWEDMCSFRRHGKNYLAVGDVGDNARKRTFVTIYVFEEPKLEVTKRVEQIVITSFAKIDITYPGGPVDCESLAYDPKLDQLLLASKELLRCRLFTLPVQLENTSKPIVAQAKQTLTLPMTTAADISTDGQQLVIATYGPACLMRRAEGDSWDQSESALKILPMPPRKQGESICFADDNSALLLSSEFVPTPLWTVRLAD